MPEGPLHHLEDAVIEDDVPRVDERLVDGLRWNQISRMPAIEGDMAPRHVMHAVISAGSTRGIPDDQSTMTMARHLENRAVLHSARGPLHRQIADHIDHSGEGEMPAREDQRLAPLRGKHPKNVIEPRRVVRDAVGHKSCINRTDHTGSADMRRALDHRGAMAQTDGYGHAGAVV